MKLLSKFTVFVFLATVCLVLASCSGKTTSHDENVTVLHQSGQRGSDDYVEEDDDLFEDELFDEDVFDDDGEFTGGNSTEVDEPYDPLEPINRVFFVFNDKLYVWVLRPVTDGYSAIVPHDLRYMFGNFFFNISSPVRFINNLLQGEFVDAGAVFSRFIINTTMGVFGLGDPAGREFGIEPRSADFGETLGKWGIGEGVYFCWPFFGPSNIRDTAGLVADGFMHPMYTLQSGELIYDMTYYGLSRLNLMSISPDVYGDMKKIALDPYVATRQAFFDYRRNLINTKDGGWVEQDPSDE